MPSRISLAPPPTEAEIEKAHDKWADPAMPENSQLLLPHTQQLLRIARSGRFGTKRKAAPEAEPDGDEFAAREEEGLPDEILAKPVHHEEKGFVARKWRQVPEAALVPEHLHWEFLAKRRKGLASFYHGSAPDASTAGPPQIAKRKTRVQRVLDPATGESAIYEVLALEGQMLENELPAESQMQAVQLAPGTTIEGLGTANDEGLISLVPANANAPPRRNRPPPKKKGGPGRGKKRVTFTNPDGSTYTTIVPNATKIVPQPGQTVKHVAKGEDAGKDVSLEEARRLAHENGIEFNEGEDEGDDDDEVEDGGDDDDREDGEIQDEDAEVAFTPGKKPSAEPVPADNAPVIPESLPAEPIKAEDPSAEQMSTEPSLPDEAPTDKLPAEPQPDVDVDVEMEDRPAATTEQATEVEAAEEQPAATHEETQEEAGGQSPEKPTLPEGSPQHEEKPATTPPPKEAPAPGESAPALDEPAQVLAPEPDQQHPEEVDAVDDPAEAATAPAALVEEDAAATENAQAPAIDAADGEPAAQVSKEESQQQQPTSGDPATKQEEEKPAKAPEQAEEDLLGGFEKSLEG